MISTLQVPYINVQYNKEVIIVSEISKDKVRYALTLLRKDKSELEKIAKKQNRSLNNLIETILKEYLHEERD